MTAKVFYSWQSDLPNKTNRGLIQTALESAVKAIRDDDSIHVEPVVERDTAGVPGAPDIGATIFAKIDQASAIVCDVSIINGSAQKGGRPTPNPNVLIELGYASKAIGWGGILMIVNEAYGSVESLPFDLRLKRALKFHSAEQDTDRATVRRALQKAIEAELRVILAATFHDRTDPQRELNLIVAHRLRDAITSVTYPIHAFLSKTCDADTQAAVSKSFDIGGTIDRKGSLKPLLAALRAPVILQPCSGFHAPKGLRWVDWFLEGLKDCSRQCRVALDRHSTNADIRLVIELEKVQSRVDMMVYALTSMLVNGQVVSTPDVWSDFFGIALETVLSAERHWREVVGAS